MGNEVVIEVHVDDNMTASDMEAVKRKVITSAGRAGDEGGKVLGDGLVRGIDGRLRDSRGRFVSIGSGLGDPLGKGMGGSAGLGLIAKLKDFLPSMGPLGAIAGAAMAPVLGAALSAGVTGGAAGLGIIGGVVLAARDPQVKAAGAQLGQSLLGQLEKDSSSFIQPVLRNIDKIEDRFAAMSPRITSIFKGSSGFLDPLVDGALDGLDSILRGVDALVANGGPVIDAFGYAFDELGDAIGDAMVSISGGSEDAASALRDIADSSGEAIRDIGKLVHVLTELYGVVSYIPGKIQDASNWFGRLIGVTDDEADSSQKLTGEQRRLAEGVLSAGEAAGKAGLQMATYGDKMDDAASKGRSLFDSQTNVAEAVANATKVLHKNGQGLSVNSEKQRENRNALSKVAGELVRNYDAYVKVNGEGGAAAGIAERNRNAFVRLATQFTGSRKAAERLADEMGLLKPKKIDFYANTHDAQARVKGLQSAINSVHGKTVTVRVQESYQRARGARTGVGGPFAHGGIVGAAANGSTSSGMTLVGEHGPEILELPPGTRVSSNPDTERRLGQGGGAAGAGVGVFSWDKAGVPELVRAIMGVLRLEIRAGGGNVQQVLGVPGR